MGLTTMIGLEAVIHLAVNVGILPVTGISLPLVSYGGSGLLTTAMAIGMLIRIDRVDARSDRMFTLPDQLFS
jgi:cell division protein FtsW